MIVLSEKQERMEGPAVFSNVNLMKLLDSELWVYTTSIKLKKKKEKISQLSTHSGCTQTKTGPIQRRLAWHLHKDDTKGHEVLHTFQVFNEEKKNTHN